MITLTNSRKGQYLPIIWLAVSLCFVTANAFAAPSASAQAAGFGSVDVQKVFAGYSKKSTVDQQVADFSGKLDAQFKLQMNSPMLSGPNQQELGNLLGEATPTDADKARVTELQAISQRDSDELATLQQVKTPTDDQTARLQVLTKEQQDGQTTLQSVADNYSQQLQAEKDKLNGQVADVIKAAITTVAQQKGLAVVFDSQVALYTANDITDAVIKQVNK